MKTKQVARMKITKSKNKRQKTDRPEINRIKENERTIRYRKSSVTSTDLSENANISSPGDQRRARKMFK